MKIVVWIWYDFCQVSPIKRRWQKNNSLGYKRKIALRFPDDERKWRLHYNHIFSSRNYRYAKRTTLCYQ